jgi:hypothetical protein
MRRPFQGRPAFARELVWRLLKVLGGLADKFSNLEEIAQ